MFWKTKKSFPFEFGILGSLKVFFKSVNLQGFKSCFFVSQTFPSNRDASVSTSHGSLNMRSGSKIVKGLLECPESYGEPKKRQFGMGCFFLVLHEYSCPMGSNNHNWQPGNSLKSSLLVICLSVGCKSLCMPGIFHACFDDLIFPFLKGRHVHVFRWGGVFIYVEYPKVQDAKPNMMTRFIRSPLTLWIHDIVFVYDSIFSNWLDWCDFHPPIFYQGWMDVFVFWHHVWISLWSELHLTPWNRIARYIFKSFTVITLLNWGSKKPSFSTI